MKLPHHPISPSALVVLASLLLCQVAFAQRVVVLEFTGDKKNKLRAQVEGALKKAEVVELVSVAQYKRATKAKKVKGPRAMGPAGVKAVSKWIKLDAAVEGAVGDTFLVRILGPDGAELWSKDLPVTKGALSSDNAKRLAKAIAAAAAAGGAQRKEMPDEKEEAAQPDSSDETAEEKSEAGSEDEATDETAKSTGEGEAKQEERVITLPEVSVEETAKETTQEEREQRQQEQQAESTVVTDPNVAREQEQVRDEDLEAESKKKKIRRGPRLVQIQVLATVTWRSYCARPGVLQCADYPDSALPEDQPPGVTVNFSAQYPYMGAMFGVELFPLAAVTDGPANGLGVSGYFGRGFSLARVRSESDVDGTPPREVIALDDAYWGGVHYRYHFLLGDEKNPLVGYAGLKGGFMGRTFEVDPNANSPLPGSHRSYPMVGFEFSAPLMSLLRVEGAGHYFISPRAGIDEIAAFGSDAAGSGFGFELGFAGDVWGPLGYIAKMRFARYKDDFTGAGGKWLSGGAAEESYATTVIGVTASF